MTSKPNYNCGIKKLYSYNQRISLHGNKAKLMVLYDVISKGQFDYPCVRGNKHLSSGLNKFTVFL